ncbi:MAG TPA: transcription antitermination factor NusB [Gemmatimonadales bacterium]
MSKRPQKRRARALQVLYAWEAQGRPALDDTIRRLLQQLPRCRSDIEAAEELARGVVATIEDLDRTLARAVEHWRFERLGMVERNILRMALFEMEHAVVPPRVVINEAVELAHRFAGGTAPGFVNGVLDAAARAAGRL